MFKHHWPELYTGPWIVTGNVAKVKVLHELHRLISKEPKLSILDVGCVGLQPLEFWLPLLTSAAGSFQLTGVDVQGIDKAEQMVAQRGWKDYVTLRHGSGYELSALYAPESFTVVIATQVLEHVARLPLFMQQVATVMAHGAEGFFTIDSAHYQSRYDWRFPVRFIKNLGKKGLSFLGYEKHYDLPWMDHEVVRICEQAGLKVIECRYYNLNPIKFIHNHIIARDGKNTFIKLWFDLEELINESNTMSHQIKHFFMALYVHVAKP
jgi:2-polyprenyl-3-methyl-5-hydroxy-6-metoxy-1,4-benzoquinol methylase